MSGNSHNARVGTFFALAAFGWWGAVAPLYFKLVSGVPAFAVLSHRIAWSFVLLLVALGLMKRLGGAWAAVRDPSVRWRLAASTLLIAVNWIVFIHAVGQKRLVEASLGYFINPLLTVLLGLIVFREKLRAAQWAAIAVAAGGLGVMAWISLRGAEGLPWIAATLPISFSFYSVLRKQTAVGALEGLFVETSMLAPPAMVYLAWFHGSDGAASANTPGMLGILALSGVVTTLPLVWFAAGAKRLPLTAIGFMQFINPTLQFLTAVAVFHEPLNQGKLAAFALIWVAVAIFVVDLALRRRVSASG